MSTRISSLGALLLAACSPEAAVPATEEDDLIACALGGAGSFTRDCAVERSRGDAQAEGGVLLVVRHPDGGFRRFVVADDRLGVAPADGAEPATLTFRDDSIEVAVGGDRYRFPAEMTADGGE